MDLPAFCLTRHIIDILFCGIAPWKVLEQEICEQKNFLRSHVLRLKNCLLTDCEPRDGDV